MAATVEIMSTHLDSDSDSSISDEEKLEEPEKIQIHVEYAVDKHVSLICMQLIRDELRKRRKKLPLGIEYYKVLTIKSRQNAVDKYPHKHVRLHIVIQIRRKYKKMAKDMSRNRQRFSPCICQYNDYLSTKICDAPVDCSTRTLQDRYNLIPIRIEHKKTKYRLLRCCASDRRYSE